MVSAILMNKKIWLTAFTVASLTKILLVPFVVASVAAPWCASADEPVETPKTRILHIDVNGKDQVVIAGSGIVTIAKHRFLLNGNTPVTEVTIDTVGNNSLRFYCVEAKGADLSLPSSPSPKELSGQVDRQVPGSLKQKGQSVDPVPSIKFPEGTYGHTIEYQVKNTGDLDTIFKQACAVWESGAEKAVKIKLSK